jgi:hypothetical protein
VPQLRRDGAYDRFKNFSFPKLNAAVSVQAGRYIKCVYEVDGATMEYVFPAALAAQGDEIPKP